MQSHWIQQPPQPPVPLAPARFLAEDMMFRFGQSHKLLGVKVSELVQSRHTQGSAALVHNFQFSLWPPYESKAIIFSLISACSKDQIQKYFGLKKKKTKTHCAIPN